MRVNRILICDAELPLKGFRSFKGEYPSDISPKTTKRPSNLLLDETTPN
jgi:hypothetical protein